MVDTPALAAEHPAANYCRGMGPDWYLPSVAELALIYNNKASLGTSYSCVAVKYWSATQGNTGISWYVDFSNGSNGTDNKLIYFRLRCVREL